MAKFKFDGINEYASKIYALEISSTGMIKRAVWEGARVVMDAVKTEINALPEISERRAMIKTDQIAGITPAQKRGLLDGCGLAKMQDEDGYINTKLGFAGYNSTKTRAYPNGQPNLLIARAVNSGTSFRKKIPFINRAVKAAKADAEAAMRARLDEDIKEKTK